MGGFEGGDLGGCGDLGGDCGPGVDGGDGVVGEELEGVDEADDGCAV